MCVWYYKITHLKYLPSIFSPLLNSYLTPNSKIKRDRWRRLLSYFLFDKNKCNYFIYRRIDFFFMILIQLWIIRMNILHVAWPKSSRYDVKHNVAVLFMLKNNIKNISVLAIGIYPGCMTLTFPPKINVGSFL